ncbi:MAG: hypothetical protein AAF721_42500, partial [Myxococcota bacterium]
MRSGSPTPITATGTASTATNVGDAAIWTLLVYCPFAYWVWGQPDNSLLTLFGTFGHAYDWAGGLVVHQAAGVAALVLAIVI